jgi:hypothetical protein
MAADIKISMDSDEAEPMRAEVFDIAVSALSFHGARQETPRIVQAARAVLVDGMRPGEAATRFDFPPERVSEAVGRIRDKWAAICNERGLVTETFSLSPTLIGLIRQIELEALQPLQAEAEKRRKKATALPKEKQGAEEDAKERENNEKQTIAPAKKTSKTPLKPALQKVAEKRPVKYKSPSTKPKTRASARF